MKSPTFSILFIVFPILCFSTIADYKKYCPHIHEIPHENQPPCPKFDTPCINQFGGKGQCSRVKSSGNILGKCCPNPVVPEDFQTNQICDDSKLLQSYDLYCKNGYVWTLGKTAFEYAIVKPKSLYECKLNKHCKNGSYCVFRSEDRLRKCYVIEGVKEKAEEAEEEERKKNQKESDNMMLIIVIVSIVVVLIAILVAAVAILICRKTRKAKMQKQGSAVKGKTSKEKMSKTKNGSNA